MMSRRQMLMMLTEEQGLPSEYLQVEYLESTGTQKIDTGISGGCEIDFTAKSRETSSGIQIVVGRDYSGGTYVGKTNVWTLGGNINFSSGITDWTDIHAVYSASSLVCTIESETKTRNGTASYDKNYFLFATGVNNSYNASVMIKSCTIYQNGAKVRDLVPCIRISDSKPGMYDLVGRQFYVNAGTGEFVVGWYVDDGLVLNLDGLNRGGVSGEWHNLAGSNIATLSGQYEELQNCVKFPATQTPYGLGTFNSKSGIEVSSTVGTIEYAVELTAVENTGRPVISIGNNMLSASIGSGDGTNGPVSRYYMRSGETTSYRFNDSAGETKLIVSINADIGICNGKNGFTFTNSSWGLSGSNALLASRGTGNPFKGKIYSVRFYNRKLTAKEMLRNQKVDNYRYQLGLNI